MQVKKWIDILNIIDIKEERGGSSGAGGVGCLVCKDDQIHLGREGRVRKDEVTVHVHGIVCQDG